MYFMFLNILFDIFNYYFIVLVYVYYYNNWFIYFFNLKCISYYNNNLDKKLEKFIYHQDQYVNLLFIVYDYYVSKYFV